MGRWFDQSFAADDIPIVLSPIVDRAVPYGWSGNLMAHIPFERFGLYQNQRILYLHSNTCAIVLARSDLEAKSLASIGISTSKIKIVRLGVDVDKEQLVSQLSKKDHVFHLSHLNQKRKNVRALIKSCRKLDVKLRLAGKISEKGFKDWLDKNAQMISSYISWRLSEEQVVRDAERASILSAVSE